MNLSQERGQFQPEGFNLNKLGRHSLKGVSYQISKLQLFGFFLKEDSLSFSFWLPWQLEFSMELKLFEQFLKVTTKGTFL
jgi:hypothetical protein